MSCKLAIEDLNLYYGDFHALKSIHMEIQPNEITAFIGPSGCGKSTLLKSLNRMNDLVEGCRITGAVKLDGEDIYHNGNHKLPLLLSFPEGKKFFVKSLRLLQNVRVNPSLDGVQHGNLFSVCVGVRANRVHPRQHLPYRHAPVSLHPIMPISS